MIAAPAPVYHAYAPRGAAYDLFGLRDPELLIEGPAGTGKTRGVLEKINGVMCKYPGARGLITRKTRASMTQTVLVTFEEKVLPKNPALYPETTDVLRRNRQSYVYPNGSELSVIGLDNPDRIMSAEFDIAAVFEGIETTVDDHEKITTRLRNGVVPYQQIMVDVNPGPPGHWLNQRADTERVQRQMRRLKSRHEDNPTLWDSATNDWTTRGRDYVLGKLEALTGARKERLRHGRWAQAEGIVYENFDAKRNIIDAENAPNSLLVVVENGIATLQLPAGWRRIRSIDFGFTNPFVCQWYAIDPDGRMYLYREVFGTRRIVEDWAPIIVSLSANERIEATVADHDAGDRATLERHGVTTIAAMKAVTPGIQAVEARLRPAGDGIPRLMMLRDALHEVDPALQEAKRPVWSGEEIEAYSYPKGVDGKPNKEEPSKENDHGMDAMRYAVAFVDNVGREPVSIRVIGGGASGGTTKTGRQSNEEDLWRKL